ncbi:MULTISPECIES: hypothetical protein [Clostridium]|uniref:Uncharacterized protein n=1 Tax=Clostridium butyricum E4 str. BoNT E BL5262 TaxID=632245 RepID=C4IH64_CLOBU|nr:MULTISPECIES: hypothetical protein [Clostridium]APF23524.1 hypothetical protein NPD4_1175 [Clostridium butyricum]EDT75072.1 hypothetical protein CBY_0151 [Clostridium butyricum 5521]EEP54580.1 hypothetical protein CLP_3022 [Clostridium butyricum E4 str. BoNT E BL5262]EMU53905.1 hypothetical protein CBDKU1_22100 [Clostridium butyricum DKU-01]MCQ2016706.1 hypothetical protein [Clostridium butyricum]
MDRIFTKEELAGSAYNIINELLKDAEFLGEKFYKSIIIDDDNDISVLDNNKKFQREYSLSEVSYLLSDSIDGFWEADKSFIEYVNYLEKKIEDKYCELNQYNFIEYCKSVYNLKYKTLNVYSKLKEIERLV